MQLTPIITHSYVAIYEMHIDMVWRSAPAVTYRILWLINYS